MKTLRRRFARLDRAYNRLTGRFYNAVLSMRMRRWLREPDEPRDARVVGHVRLPASRTANGFGPGSWVEDDDRWPDFRQPPDDDDGLAGSRIPRRPVLDPGAASVALFVDETADLPEAASVALFVDETADLPEAATGETSAARTSVDRRVPRVRRLPG